MKKLSLLLIMPFALVSVKALAMQPERPFNPLTDTAPPAAPLQRGAQAAQPVARVAAAHPLSPAAAAHASVAASGSIANSADPNTIRCVICQFAKYPKDMGSLEKCCKQNLCFNCFKEVQSRRNNPACPFCRKPLQDLGPAKPEPTEPR